MIESSRGNRSLCDLLTTLTSMVLSLTAPTQPVIATSIRQTAITTMRVAGVKKWSSMKMLKSSKMVEIVVPTAIKRKALSCGCESMSVQWRINQHISRYRWRLAHPLLIRRSKLIKWKIKISIHRPNRFARMQSASIRAKWKREKISF